MALKNILLYNSFFSASNFIFYSCSIIYLQNFIKKVKRSILFFLLS